MAQVLLEHFDKAAAVVAWLNASRELSLGFPHTDPRYGIPIGDSEADNFVRVEGEGNFGPPTPPLHYYASAAATARGFLELGKRRCAAIIWQIMRVGRPRPPRLATAAHTQHHNCWHGHACDCWAGRVFDTIGTAHRRPQMVALGDRMVATSALLRRDVAASMKRTVIQSDATANNTRCWPFAADPQARACTNVHAGNSEITPWRSYAEWMYVGGHACLACPAPRTSRFECDRLTCCAPDGQTIHQVFGSDRPAVLCICRYARGAQRSV